MNTIEFQYLYFTICGFLTLVVDSVFVDSGVTVDIWTSYAARIMAISVIPFVIVQLPQMLGSTSGRQLSVLVALILSVLMLISYCVYQVT